jgi:hypothetical protein
VSPPGDPLDPIALAAEIDREIRALPDQGVQPVRVVRRAWSRRLRSAPAEGVAGVAMALVHGSGGSPTSCSTITPAGWTP